MQDALFRQKGVVRVDDYDELIETANMFLKAKRPRGSRLGIVSHSGGIGSFLADKCGEAGLELPCLSDQTSDCLGTILGERGSAANPADVTGFAMTDTFPRSSAPCWPTRTSTCRSWPARVESFRRAR